MINKIGEFIVWANDNGWDIAKKIGASIKFR